MSLQEYLEADEEKIMQALNSADTAEQCVPILERETDRLLYLYNENTDDDDLRAAADGLMRQVRTGAALSNTGGKTSVYVSADSRSENSKKGASSALLTAGSVCMAVVLVSALIPSGILNALGKLILTAVLLTAGSVFLFLAGKKHAPEPFSDRHTSYITQTKPDTVKIYQVYRAMILTADRTLTEENDRLRLREHKIAEEAGEKGILPVSSWNEKDIALISDLLEASYSRDGGYALDKLSQLKFRLHQEGIETVDYTPENEKWFDLLPASKTATIRPALVFNGQLLKKGLAGMTS